jgi:acyl dehydratase
MSQGFLAAMIHRWAPAANITSIDTVFRAPVIVDQAYHIKGVVTDIDEATGQVEIDLTVVNDAGETRVFGTATVRLPSA